MFGVNGPAGVILNLKLNGKLKEVDCFCLNRLNSDGVSFISSLVREGNVVIGRPLLFRTPRFSYPRPDLFPGDR